jgi:hypothetical protein
MYADRPATFEALVAPFPARTQEITVWLRDLFLSEFPQLEENMSGGTKVGIALYSIGGAHRVALGIQPGEAFVKLYLHDPELLPPSSFKLEGRGRHMRHIKLAAIPLDRRDELLSLARVPVERRS